MESVNNFVNFSSQYNGIHSSDISMNNEEVLSYLTFLKHQPSSYYSSIIRLGRGHELATSVRDFQHGFNLKYKNLIDAKLINPLRSDGYVGQNTEAALEFEREILKKGLANLESVFKYIKFNSLPSINVGNVDTAHTIREFQTAFNMKNAAIFHRIDMDGVIGKETMKALTYELSQISSAAPVDHFAPSTSTRTVLVSNPSSISQPGDFDVEKLINNNPSIDHLSILELGTTNISSFKGDDNPRRIGNLIKLFVVVAMNETGISLDEPVSVPRELIASGEESSFQSGASYTARSLMESMLKDDTDTSFNALLNHIGQKNTSGVDLIQSTDNVTNIVQSLGFQRTRLVNYLSAVIPGEVEHNKSTSNEVTQAMNIIFSGNSKIYDEAKSFLESANSVNRFSYTNRIANKTGLNNRVLADSAVIEVDGKRFVITAIDDIEENHDSDPNNDIQLEQYFNGGDNPVTSIIQEFVNGMQGLESNGVPALSVIPPSVVEVHNGSSLNIEVVDDSQLTLPSTERLSHNLSNKTYTVFIEVRQSDGSITVAEKQLTQAQNFTMLFLDTNGKEWMIHSFQKLFNDHGVGKTQSNPFPVDSYTVVENVTNLKPSEEAFLMPSPGNSGIDGMRNLENMGYEIIAVLGSGFVDSDSRGRARGEGYQFVRGMNGEPDFEYIGNDDLKNCVGYYTTDGGDSVRIDLSSFPDKSSKLQEINDLKSDSSVIAIHLISFESLEVPEFGTVRDGNDATNYNVARSFLTFDESGEFMAHTVTNSMRYTDQVNVASQSLPDSESIIALDGDYYARRAIFDDSISSNFSREEALLSPNPIFLVRRKPAEQPVIEIEVDVAELQQMEAEGLQRDDQMDKDRVMAGMKEDPWGTTVAVWNKVTVKVGAAWNGFMASAGEQWNAVSTAFMRNMSIAVTNWNYYWNGR